MALATRAPAEPALKSTPMRQSSLSSPSSRTPYTTRSPRVAPMLVLKPVPSRVRARTKRWLHIQRSPSPISARIDRSGASRCRPPKGSAHAQQQDPGDEVASGVERHGLGRPDRRGQQPAQRRPDHEGDGSGGLQRAGGGHQPLPADRARAGHRSWPRRTTRRPSTCPAPRSRCEAGSGHPARPPPERWPTSSGAGQLARDHQPAAVRAVGNRPRHQAEQEVRQGGDGDDERRLGRRPGPVEDQDRQDHRAHRRPCGRDRMGHPEPHERTVPAAGSPASFTPYSRSVRCCMLDAITLLFGTGRRGRSARGICADDSSIQGRHHAGARRGAAGRLRPVR